MELVLRSSAVVGLFYPWTSPPGPGWYSLNNCLVVQWLGNYLYLTLWLALATLVVAPLHVDSAYLLQLGTACVLTPAGVRGD